MGDRWDTARINAKRASAVHALARGMTHVGCSSSQLEAVRIAGSALGLSLRIGISMQSELLSGDRQGDRCVEAWEGAADGGVVLIGQARRRPASMPCS